MRMKLIAIVGVLLALSTGLWAGGTGEKAPAAGKQITIGVSMDNLTSEYWVAAKRGMDKAATQYGVKLLYRTAEADAVKQNAQIDSLSRTGSMPLL